MEMLCTVGNNKNEKKIICNTTKLPCIGCSPCCEHRIEIDKNIKKDN